MCLWAFGASQYLSEVGKYFLISIVWIRLRPQWGNDLVTIIDLSVTELGI